MLVVIHYKANAIDTKVFMSVPIDQVWQDFLKIIREEVGTRVVETWIKAVSLSRYDQIDQKVYLSAPNQFVKNWVEMNYKELFQMHLKRLLGVEQLHIVFCLGSCTTQVEVLQQQPSRVVPAVAAKKKYQVSKKISGYTDNSSKLNPLYKFDMFVVGENNSFAYASARAVTQKLGSLYNPLLLYGSSGLGKTHLLHAIGNEVKERFSNAVVLYQTTDRFVSEFIYSIRFDQVAKFHAKYRKVDVLLLDDIQFMVNKEQTQEAFFHIFNTLYDANKQIVLSSDTLPRYLGGLVDRLKSRLEWGLIADVQVPMLETKMAILKRKAEMQKEVLSDDVIMFIASQPVSSVRELESSLIRVLAYSSLTNQEVSIDLVRKVLGKVQEVKPATTVVDFKTIIDLVEKSFSYGLTDLRSKDRSKGVSHARQVAMYLMKKYTGKSLREIGEYLDRKDHTTITHAIQRIKMLMVQDEQIAHQLKHIEKSLY